MSHKLHVVIIFSFILIVLAAFIPNEKVQTTDQRLEQKLNDVIMNNPDLDGALLGVSVRIASSGDLLYEHKGNIRLKPASNMKLLTSTAALSTLGEDYVFKTEILSDGKRRGDTLKGNLYLKGRGDPTLLQSDFIQMAKRLKDQGINHIEGDIVGDDTWFDDKRYSKDMVWEDEQAYYGAQISALTASPNEDYDAGTVIIEVKPGHKENAPLQVDTIPNTEYISITNNATTSSVDSTEQLSIERKHGTNQVTIEGTVPKEATTIRKWIAVWNPTGYALALFQQALKNQEITWTGEGKLGQVSEQADVLVVNQSMPLSELLIPFMKLSNNGHAETLVKAMGKLKTGEGSWNTGLEVMNNELLSYGLNTDTLVIRDGSGISHVNLIPANEITQLLYGIQEEDWFPAFKNSLPIAGSSDRLVGGTLRYRMEDIDDNSTVLAKTGTLSTVSSLSGYIQKPNDENIIFSIIINNMVDEDRASNIEDELVKVLIDY